MLSTDEFASWSKRVVLFLHNTSHVDDEPYPNLLFEKGGIGFPTVSFLDADGNLLKWVGNVTPLEDLDKAHQQLLTWQALRKQVEAGATDKERELFLVELEMGNRPFAEMTARLAKLQFDDGERNRVEQQLVNLQFTEILRATPRDRQHEGGEQFLAMFRQGRIPNSTTETSFWQYLFAFAEHNGDVSLFEEVLAWLKRTKAKDQRLERYVQQLEAQLAKLKSRQGVGRQQQPDK